MNEMVERVVRAMEARLGCCTNSSDVNPIIDPLHPDLRAALPGLARAAIAAMREPSDPMLDCGKGAGWSGVIEGDDKLEREAAGYLWRDMIDAALKEP